MRVGLTGSTSDFGRGLLPRLVADPQVESIVAFDLVKPNTLGIKTSWLKVDLTRLGVEEEFSAALRDHKIDVLYHLAFVNSRVHGASFAHELEVIGTMHVLSAVQAVGLKRLIIPSLTALYGARAHAPSRFREAHSLEARGVRFLTDRVEVEHHLEQFRLRNPSISVATLRFAPIVGPTSDNPLTRLLLGHLVPTLWGFDPVWQVLDERDAAVALHLALTAPADGAYNIVSDALVPFSALVRAAGSRCVPLLMPALRVAIQTLEAAGLPSVPLPLLEYLRYPCIADGTRARQALSFQAQVPFDESMASMRRRKTE
jgi:UDP-glucose 4-epimerase